MDLRNLASGLMCVGLLMAAGCAGDATANATGAGGAGGGSEVSASGGGPPCPGGIVDFELRAAPGEPFFVQEAYPPCADANWLRLSDNDGAAQAFIYPGASLACDTCTVTTWSAVCTTSTAEPVMTSHAEWDGHRFAGGTCGGGATCARRECVPAGHYQATMCAAMASSLSAPLRCVQVPFDYPAPGPVVGLLPPIASHSP
jgi:hypothetical protein